MSGTKLVHVAVGVIRRNGRVLIARRPDHVHQGGLLEFPGGKVEPGETVQEALVREILEETGLGLSPASLTPLIGIRHDYGDKQVFLDVWEAGSAEGDGEPEGREGQPVEWRHLSDLADSDFPAANRPIIRALRLPRRYAITGAADGYEGRVEVFLGKLRQSLAMNHQALCLLRAPGLDDVEYRQLVTEATRPADWNRGVQWMLHGDAHRLEDSPDAAGLHMPWREARKYDFRPVDNRYLLAISCHNLEEIRHAVDLGADFITLGPVKATGSHPGAEPMAAQVFRDLVEQSPVVVYGLGGLSGDDEHSMIACGAQGIAGISFWWQKAYSQNNQ